MKSSVFDRRKTEDVRAEELKKLADALQRPANSNPAPQGAGESTAK